MTSAHSAGQWAMKLCVNRKRSDAMSNELGKLLTLKEVAAKLNVSLWTARRYASQRRIPTLRVVGRVTVPEAELDRWLAARVESPRGQEADREECGE